VSQVNNAARDEIILTSRNVFGPDVLSEQRWVEFAVEACETKDSDLEDLTERYGIAEAGPSGQYSLDDILNVMTPICRERFIPE
jgi:hypothetical protein